MHRYFLLILILAFVLTGCGHQPQPAEPVMANTPTPEKVHIIRTMITGMDQYGAENILVLNTMDTSYVIGPNVSGPQLSEIHTHLTEAHDRVITIRYVDKPATTTTLAHKRVMGLVIEDKIYELNH